MARKHVALGVATAVAGIYGYIVWKRQMVIYKEAKARAIDSIKTTALKVVTGAALVMGVYIYLGRESDTKKKLII